MKNIVSRYPTSHGLSLQEFLSASTQIHFFVNPADTNRQTNQGKKEPHGQRQKQPQKQEILQNQQKV